MSKEAPQGYSFKITRPDDFHIHVRQGAMAKAVLPHSAAQMGRVIIMPNLVPPVTTVALAKKYYNELQSYLPKKSQLQLLMTLYMTDDTDPAEIKRAKQSGFVHAVKIYPAGATTNSHAGVTDFKKLAKTLAMMQEVDLPLLIHPEVADNSVDVFDREKKFVDQTAAKLVKDFPNLRIVFEHLTCKESVQFVKSARKKVAGTITAHHLLCDRNDMLGSGINPHLYCKPILKRREDQEALLKAATSGHEKFFAGTDSAPHLQHLKENACGCAGVYTAFAAAELYAEAFDMAGDLANQKTAANFEKFISVNGAKFYGLPKNTTTVTFTKKPQTVPATFSIGKDKLVPFRAGQTIAWSMTNAG